MQGVLLFGSFCRSMYEIAHRIPLVLGCCTGYICVCPYGCRAAGCELSSSVAGVFRWLLLACHSLGWVSVAAIRMLYQSMSRR
ncbi:hypothetical protein F5Y10DRAFT_191738 [Nemania abortiva]|nr:hypothetical protein F5Y10DRAFT_191738 [Nemania abortiva]